MRRELMSTVFRNVADAGGGAAPKVEDVVAPVVAVEVAAAAPAVETVAVPAVEVPAVVEVAAAAEPVPAVVEEPAKGFEDKTLLTAEEPKVEAPKEAPVEAKPAEPAKVEDAKPAEPKPGEPAQPEAPKEAPVYAYEFPEGMKVDAEALKPINETFAKHGISPDVAKDLMGLHVGEMQKYANAVVQQSADDQRRVYAETRGQWRDEIRSDERLGGAGYETTLRQAAEVRDKLVPKEDMAAFNRMMLVTGCGDHPEFVRFCKAAHRFVGEAAIPGAQGNPSPHNGSPGGKRRLRDTYNNKTA